jgi:RNA polymerase sigma factor (sigma-70 family)
MATRIIVCDDHPMFRGGLVAALAEERDIELAGEAGSLAELRQLLDATTTATDLILLDIELPDGTATGAIGELAARAGVVVISAHDDPVLVRHALQAGALGYIRKDAEPDEVLRLVRRAATGKTALSGEMALRVAESLRRDPDRPSFARSLDALPPRQREVVALIAEGRSNREIADRLCISEGTVKNYVTKILEAVDVTDRTKLAILLVRHQMKLGGQPAR